VTAAAQGHDAFEVGKLLARERLDVVHAEELAHGEEHPRAALAQHVAGLDTLEAGVERHEHTARRLEPDGGQDPLDDVGRPDGHAVAVAQARGVEGARGAQPRVGELGEAQEDVAVLDGATLPVARGRGLHETRDGPRALRSRRSLHTNRIVS
jgi:hypothetical protein